MGMGGRRNGGMGIVGGVGAENVSSGNGSQRAIRAGGAGRAMGVTYIVGEGLAGHVVDE